ncbi:Peroxiredoxin [Sinomicrobium oceani]|uniref:Peroxiredoxin n=1 Tax=Sinomicrobium oceani TaxID=1150368 RepID=A0A1K1RVI8_9FLAO|nr:TlpA disulfide reductase family protein [Sinomicrobium oceani]SFW76163.1 Peroxiredoxin [Sinomicrobium oceani]
MKKYKFLFVLLFLLLTAISCKKHVSSTISGPGTVYISGKIIGSIPKDSVKFILEGEIPFNPKIGGNEIIVETDGDGKFKYRSPVIDKPGRITLFAFRKRPGEMGSRFNDALRNYLIAPGDSIHMVIDKTKEETSFSFSGRGAEKFKCRWSVDQHGYTANPRMYDERRKTYDLNVLDRYRRRVELADSIIDVQIGELNKHRKGLSREIYQIIKADIIGDTNSHLKDFWYLRLSNENVGEDEISELRKMIDQSGISGIDNDLLAMSPFYIRFLSLKTIAELCITHPEQKEYEFKNIYVKRFGDLCAVWKNQYEGILREKLLLFNLQNLKVQDTDGLNACLKESYVLFQTPSLRKIIEDWYGKKTKGVAAFDFALPDTTGRMVRLSDFRGKVVYIDIWFTGCGGCASLAEKVDKLVYPKFRDNPEVVFVSISGDKNKERWLKSVEGEKYGLKEYVNLYTNGEGFDHPFMKYYGIRGGPTTMLIDKEGNIYSAAPPKQGDDKKMKALIALIEEALIE